MKSVTSNSPKPRPICSFRLSAFATRPICPSSFTSNKAFGDWAGVFAGDPVMASAALDRLLHKSTIINIRGDSYRLKEKRLAGLSTTINPQTSSDS